MKNAERCWMRRTADKKQTVSNPNSDVGESRITNWLTTDGMCSFNVV